MMRLSDRRYRKFRLGILIRDGRRGRYRYAGCTEVATQVEHLRPRRPPYRGGVYDESNCFSVCHSCHREKERLERAGLPVDGFLRAEPLGNAPVSAHTYGRTERDRRNLLLGDDYARKAPKKAARRRCAPRGVVA